MGATNQSSLLLFSAERAIKYYVPRISVAGMTNVIEHVNDYEVGQFVAFDGKIVPY